MKKVVRLRLHKLASVRLGVVKRDIKEKGKKEKRNYEWRSELVDVIGR